MSMLSHAEELVVWSAWSASGINGQNGHFMGQRCLSALNIVFHVLCWIGGLGRRVDGLVGMGVARTPEGEALCLERKEGEDAHLCLNRLHCHSSLNLLCSFFMTIWLPFS